MRAHLFSADALYSQVGRLVGSVGYETCGMKYLPILTVALTEQGKPVHRIVFVSLNLGAKVLRIHAVGAKPLVFGSLPAHRVGMGF